jgi:hypothetical protein
MADLAEIRQNLRMKRTLAALLGISLVLGLSACGESSKLYASSKDEGVFFSVPTNWTLLSPAALTRYEKKSEDPEVESRNALVKWQIAYTTNPKFKVSEVFNLIAPSQPLVFARVRELSGTEINEFSYNSLRDVIVPVTKIIEGEVSGTPDFEIVRDQEVVEKGARGVQTIYRFTFEGVSQTFNQISLLANDRTKLYLFVVRCESKCYNKNKKAIGEIVSSFTVQGAK